MAGGTQIRTGKEADLWSSMIGLPQAQSPAPGRTVVVQRKAPKQEATAKGQEAGEHQSEAQTQEQTEGEQTEDQDGGKKSGAAKDQHQEQQDSSEQETFSQEELESLAPEARLLIEKSEKRAAAAEKRAQGQQSSAERRVAQMQNEMKDLILAVREIQSKAAKGEAQAELEKVLPGSDEEYLTAGQFKKVVQVASKANQEQQPQAKTPHMQQMEREVAEVQQMVQTEEGKKVLAFANTALAGDALLKKLAPLDAYAYVQDKMKVKADQDAAFKRGQQAAQRRTEQQDARLGSLPPQRTQGGQTADVTRGSGQKTQGGRASQVIQNLSKKYNLEGTALVRRP